MGYKTIRMNTTIGRMLEMIDEGIVEVCEKTGQFIFKTDKNGKSLITTRKSTIDKSKIPTPTPRVKIGRNQKVTITKGGESQLIKYKKVDPFLNDGWTLTLEDK